MEISLAAPVVGHIQLTMCPQWFTVGLSMGRSQQDPANLSQEQLRLMGALRKELEGVLMKTPLFDEPVLSPAEQAHVLDWACVRTYDSDKLISKKLRKHLRK